MGKASSFIRNESQIKSFNLKNWIGTSQRFEDNQGKNKSTKQFSNLSNDLPNMESLQVVAIALNIVELGFKQRQYTKLLQRELNSSQTYFLKSKLIQTEQK
jgi:hypothetical protein